MIRALAFYLTHDLKNRVLSRFRRLRRPKYLVSALAGLIYLYFAFFRQLSGHSPAPVSAPPSFDPEFLPLIETGFAFVLLGLVLIPWILPFRERGLAFTEAEVQFLFAAPISRRALIRFRLIKSQMGVLFGVLVSVFFFGRGGLVANPGYLFVVLWIVYSFLAFYRTGVSIVQTSLAEHGTSGVRRQVWVLLLVLLLVGSVAVWLKWFIPRPPEMETFTPPDVLAWLVQATESGPAHYFLLPFKALVRPAFAPGLKSFLLRLPAAFAVLWLTYMWVIRRDTAFEEASLERARKVTSRLRAARGNGWKSPAARARKFRRPPFTLSSQGAPHVAIFWKNLISAGRIDPRRLVPVAVIVLIVLIASTLRGGGRGAVLPTIVGMVALGITAFLALFGPVLVRDDLRSDLLNADLLKSYPLPGWSVVLGEILAPAAILAAGEWFLLALGAFFLPALGRLPWTMYHRVIFGLGAAFILPCLSLIGVLIQNAAALVMPGWLQLGKEHQRGIEAMGQRLITMAATLLVLLFAVIPGGLIFFAVFAVGYWVAGLAVLPVAAMFAAAGLLAESAFTIYLLGRLFDRFDSSLELEPAG